MAAGRLSPSPQCPQCGAEAADDANYCIDCGAALGMAEPLAPRPATASLAPARIVESEAFDAPDASQAPMALVEQRPDSNALALLPHLAAMVWRQPAVRRAVTTGASAVALSLVWRVAGAALSGRRASRALLDESDGLAPLVGDVLRSAKLSKRLSRRARRGSVIEETLYIRRIVRR